MDVMEPMKTKSKGDANTCSLLSTTTHGRWRCTSHGEDRYIDKLKEFKTVYERQWNARIKFLRL